MAETDPVDQQHLSEAGDKTAMAGGREHRLASWPLRVAATVIDGLLQLPIMIPVVIGFVLFVGGVPASEGAPANEGLIASGVALFVLAYIGLIAFSIWQLYRQGKTGSTLGKKAMGIAVIKESDAKPTGFWLAFARSLVHIADGIFYIGYLWPLWDQKSQTFADKALNTVVIRFK